jgi:ribose transport system permease protein
MKPARWLANYAIFVALLAECLVLTLATEAFFTESNLANVVRQNAFTAILAAGMSLVILTGGIDLSVGSVVGLAGVLSADALVHGAGCASPRSSSPWR